MNEFEFEIPNFAKYNPRKDVTSTTWFRASNTTFFDSKFACLSQPSKLLWFYFLAELSRAHAAKLKTSCKVVARSSGYRYGIVQRGVLELERNQLIKIVWRDADVTPYNERTRRTNERTNVHKENLTAPESSEKLELQPQQTAEKNTPKKQLEPSKTATTWESYSRAYRKRYGVDPARNRLVNSQLKSFVERVGEKDAPEIAAYFVMLNDPWYTKKGHNVGTLLHECEKIRTLCLTNKQTTEVAPKAAHILNQLNSIERGEM